MSGPAKRFKYLPALCRFAFGVRAGVRTFSSVRADHESECREYFCFVFLLSGVSAAGAQEATATGLWLTQKGDARIQVSKCGAALCGKVVWLKDAIDPLTKKPQTDDKNPNPALATRSMIGVQLFIDMNPVGPNS